MMKCEKRKEIFRRTAVLLLVICLLMTPSTVVAVERDNELLLSESQSVKGTNTDDLIDETDKEKKMDNASEEDENINFPKEEAKTFKLPEEEYTPKEDNSDDEDKSISEQEDDKDELTENTKGIARNNMGIMPAAGEITVSSQQDIIDAIGALANGEAATLVLAQNIQLTTSIQVPSGRKVTLKTDGGNANSYTITPANSIARLINIYVNAEMIVDGPIIFDADKNTVNEIIYCQGKLTINNSGSIVRNLQSSSPRVGAVFIEGTTAEFYLNDGIIEDNTVATQYCGAGVLVRNGGYFEMNGGIIRNNRVWNASPATNTANSSGGVLVYAVRNSATPANAYRSEFVMKGGEISGNSAAEGAGVFLYGADPNSNDFYSRAIFTMDGGKITGNKAADNKKNSGGGGVYVLLGSEFTMNDGEITNNESVGMGGGVATYDAYVNYYGKQEYHAPWYDWFPASFTMNGGKINDNIASVGTFAGDGGCGGGVYSASSKFKLYGGEIKGNVAGRQGGGVYVGSVPYSVELSDALVTNNEATLLGGGIWLCPTGDAMFYSQRSAAIYDNRTTGDPAAGDDVAVVRQLGKIFDIKLSDRMLGGGKTNWNDDGEIDNTSELGMPVASAPRYDSDNPSPRENLEGTDLGSLALKAVPSETAKSLAKAQAKLIIENNTSERGGGIGSNGTVILGDAESIDKAIIIKKEWSNIPEGYTLPTKVTVYLQIDGYNLDKIELTAENNWMDNSITGLPMDAEAKVVEVTVENFKASYKWEEEDDGKTLVVTIDNRYTPIADLEITKVDEDDSDITLSGAGYQLYRDDEPKQYTGVDEDGNATWGNEPKTFTTDAQGKLIFEGLSPGKYYVKEVVAPAGYVLDETIHEITVTPHDTTVIKKQLTNKKLLKEIELTKVDEKDSDLKLKGAKYILINSDDEYCKNGSGIAQWDADKDNAHVFETDENGKIVFPKVPLGTYYVQEIEAPADYELDSTKYKVEITAESENIVKIERTNKKKTIIKVIKQWKDATGNELDMSNSIVAGIVVELYANGEATGTTITIEPKYDNGSQKFVWEGEFKNLDDVDEENETIKYTIVEKEIIYKEGLLEEQKLDFEVNIEEDGTTFTMTNTILGKITIVKEDENGNTLEGVEFELFEADDSWKIKEDVTSKVGITDNDGKMLIDKLPAGKYLLVETKTIEGKQLLKEPIRIEIPYSGSVTSGTINGMPGILKLETTERLYYHLTYTISNAQGFDIPNSGGAGVYVVYAFGILCIALSGYIYYMKRRKKSSA